MSNVEHDASGFTADGRAPFPPIYEDMKAMDFVDDQRWPTKKLMGRLAWYESFLKREDRCPAPGAVPSISKNTSCSSYCAAKVSLTSLRTGWTPMKPKTLLFYDLEVSRAIAEGYGSKWEFKVVKFIRPQLLMCYAYKWLGDKKPTFVSMHDFKTYKQFVQSLSDLLSSAPIAVAHNAVRFDNKMSNTFFITEDITPPSPFKTIDTLQVARSAFKFPSNSLNDLADYLGLGKKEQVTYAELEDDFMTKRPSGRVLRLMKRYNNKDVELLEKVYLKIRPYIKNHPNMAVYTGDAFACPGCGTADKLQRRGTRTNGLGTYQEWYCKHCDKYPSQRISDKTAIKPELVNRG